MTKTSSRRTRGSESQSSSECGDSNFEPTVNRKARTRGNKNFEKNYPKNILISIMAALNKIGAQKIYQDCQISEQRIQERNSASLHELFEVLTHPQMKSLNKACIEILASNILLQNSKISKKAFHLEVLRDVFSFDFDVSEAQFKLQMKKKASKNCGKHSSDLEIFQYQSSTIFLLTKFCKLIENYPNFSESSQITEGSLQQFKLISNCEDLAQKSIKKSNRQLLKPLICDLCLKLNRISPSKEHLNKVKNFISEQVLSTESKMRETLNLAKGVPSIKNFITDVVKQCFDLIRQRKKINFTELSKLIKFFDEKCLDSVINSFGYSKKSETQVKQIEDSQMESELHQSGLNENSIFKPLKKFTPFILIAPRLRSVKKGL